MEMLLQQKQTMNLMMTTELRQAISLLQYSTYELYQFIKEQELENPLIELVEKEENYSYRGTGKNSVRTGNSVSDPFEFIPNDGESMRQNLIKQSQWMDISEADQRIIRYLILNLDENGYLLLTTSEISSQLELTEEDVSDKIKLLQLLEPIGVGARSLQECLLLQTEYHYPGEQIVESIIKDHLNDLANKKWHNIVGSLKTTLQEVKIAFDMIQTLDPKPCTILSNDKVEYLNPDIIVEQIDDVFEVSLNDGYLPEIRYNQQYSGLINKKTEAYEYVHDKYKSYQWLISSIEQRRNTILKITHAVIRKQQGFFTSGFSALQPLTLKEIAEEIDMHESTVSRATMNKVIQTPKGSFEFRLFFTSKLNTEDGEEMSQTKVKLLLKDVVEQENKYKPFSDQKIADYFKTKKGITISRRTVAKYREELKIPASSKRKEIEL